MSTLALPRSHDPRDVDGTMAMQQLIDWNNHAIGVWMQGQPEDAEKLLWMAMTNLEEHQQHLHQLGGHDHHVPSRMQQQMQHHHQAKKLQDEVEVDDDDVLMLMMTTEDEHLDVPSADDEDDEPEDMDRTCNNGKDEVEYRSIAAVDLSLALPLSKQGSDDDDDDDCLPLYHRALVLAPTANVQEVTAVLGYNAALYHHSQALLLRHLQDSSDAATSCSTTTKTKSTAWSPWQLQLQTGLQYYDGVWQLLQQHGWIDELLVMALFYNMGHAHWQLQQKERALFCMDFLQQVLKDSPAHMMVCQALQQQVGEEDDSSTTSSSSSHVDDHAFFVVHALQQFPGEHMNLAPAA